MSFLDEEPFAKFSGDLDEIAPAGLTAMYEIGFLEPTSRD